MNTVPNVSRIVDELVQLVDRDDITELTDKVSIVLNSTCAEILNGTHGIICLDSAKKLMGLSKIS